MNGRLFDSTKTELQINYTCSSDTIGFKFRKLAEFLENGYTVSGVKHFGFTVYFTLERKETKSEAIERLYDLPSDDIQRYVEGAVGIGRSSLHTLLEYLKSLPDDNDPR